VGAGGGGVGGTPAWVLAWSDEFDGPAGRSPDATKWTYDIGGDGWGNNELEFYTSRPANVALDGAGHLSITTAAEAYMGRSYTSARIKTQGTFTQSYGRFEARIEIPRGQGIWPAFWMLGADIATNPWPACGELDIMENVGREPALNHGSLHGPGYSGGNPLTGTYTLPGGGALSDDFHVYAAEWETNTVRFYVDATLYETRRNTDVPTGARWVFDHPFFMILNVAVGGAFPGSPDATTPFPQTMLVDYVRVYARP
jgi:beta-glucanase (GH16 family)